MQCVYERSILAASVTVLNLMIHGCTISLRPMNPKMDRQTGWNTPIINGGPQEAEPSSPLKAGPKSTFAAGICRGYPGQQLIGQCSGRLDRSYGRSTRRKLSFFPEQLYHTATAIDCWTDGFVESKVRFRCERYKHQEQKTQRPWHHGRANKTISPLNC